MRSIAIFNIRRDCHQTGRLRLGPEDQIRDLDLLSAKLYSQGRFAESLANLEQVVRLIEQHRGPSDASLGSPLHNLALLYERLNKAAEAERAFRRSLAVMAGTSRAADLARTHHALAGMLVRQGRGREAEELLREALRALAPVRDAHPDLVGWIAADLAHQLMGRHLPAAALPFHEAALTSLIGAFGPECEHVGSAHNNLAVTLLALNRNDEAERHFRQSLQSLLAVVQPDDSRIRDTVGMLAAFYADAHRHAEEPGLREWYVKLCELRLTDADPRQADMLMELGRAYYRIGEYGNAERAYQRAMSDKSTARTIQGLSGIAMAYHGPGRYADAEQLCRKALEITRQSRSRDTASETSLLGNIADLLTLQNRTDEAARLLRQALTIREREFGPDHLYVARTLHTLARLRISLGDMSDETEGILRRVIRIKEADLGPDHLEVATSLSLLASVLSHQDRFKEASETYLRTLRIRRQSLGDTHRDVAMAFHNVGIHYADNGRWHEAEEFLRQSLIIFERAHGESHNEVALALTSLGNVLTRLGRTEVAAQYQSRAEAIPSWETIDIPLIFATDRRAGDQAGAFLSSQRRDRKDLALGSVTLQAPTETVGNRSSRIAEGLGFLESAVGLQTQASHLRVLRSGLLQSDAAMAGLARKSLDRSTRFQGQGFIFVHGFNTSFEEALQRAAMISFDLDFDGPVFVFSWASLSKAWRYRSDRQRARKAVPFLVETLQRIGRQLPEMKLHIFAHSTGSEITVNALDELWREQHETKPLPGGELILAHADIRPITLARTLPAITALGFAVTSYYSREDKAMSLSRWIRGDEERVGSRPVYLTGVECIDVTGLGIKRDLNHNVFVRNPAVFNDIARLLKTGVRPPDSRSPHFRCVETANGVHWAYRSECQSV